MKDAKAMRRSRAAGVFAVGLLAGCAPQFVKIPQPVGPAPIEVAPLNTGQLVVSTEEFPSGSEYVSDTYEPFAILDSSGHLVKEIKNPSVAEVVTLVAGRYSVRAQATRRRVISVEVQIVTGMTTEVHLDGYWKPEPSHAQATLVFGPEGSPIGYRHLATTTSTHSKEKP